MTAKKLFYSMGEVAEMFDVNPSLIRHWESKFDCIRPHKNKKGNRMFSPEDVDRLKQIYHLVKERGMTLEGANKVMKSSRGELSRDTELLEHLQRIRSALVEVREELKAGDSERLVDSAGEEMAGEEMAGEEPVGVEADGMVPAGKPAEEYAAADWEAGSDDDAADEQAAAEAASAGQPRKRVRRRRRSDDDNDKELFPFYEQSLF